MTDRNPKIPSSQPLDEEEWMDIGEALKPFYSNNDNTHSNDEAPTLSKDRQDTLCCPSSEKGAIRNNTCGLLENHEINCYQNDVSDPIKFQSHPIPEHTGTLENLQVEHFTVLEDDKILDSRVEYIRPYDQCRSSLQNQNNNTEYDVNRIKLFEELATAATVHIIQERITAEPEKTIDEISTTRLSNKSVTGETEIKQIPAERNDISDLETCINPGGTDKRVKNELDNLVEFITPHEKRTHANTDEIVYKVEFDQLNLEPSEIQIEHCVNRQDGIMSTKYINPNHVNISEDVVRNQTSEPKSLSKNQMPVSKSNESFAMFENTHINNCPAKQMPILKKFLSTDYINTKVQAMALENGICDNRVSNASERTLHNNKQQTEYQCELEKMTLRTRRGKPKYNEHIEDYNEIENDDLYTPTQEVELSSDDENVDNKSLHSETRKMLTQGSAGQGMKYKCDICSKLFSRNCHVLRHKRNIHNIVIEDQRRNRGKRNRAKNRCGNKEIEKTPKSSVFETQDNRNVTDNENFNSTVGFSNDGSAAVTTNETVLLQQDVVVACKDSTTMNKSEVENAVTETHNETEVIQSQHQQSHTAQRPSKLRHSCDICQKVCKSYTSLRYHKKTAHSGKEYKCKICSMLFSWKHNVIRHNREVHNIAIENQHTNRLITNISKDSTTIDNSEVVNTFPSTHTETSVTESVYQQSHIAKLMKEVVHSGNKYECEICSKLFKRKPHVLRHKRLVHKIAIEDQRRSHGKTNTSENHCGDKAIEKTIQSSVFETQDNRNVTDNENFNSTVGFSNEGSTAVTTNQTVLLQQDVVGACIDSTEVNNPGVKNTITGTHNETEVIQSEHQQSHIAQRSSKFTHSCEICQKVCKSYQSLRYHKETTHSGKEYKCEICSMFFSWKSHILRHKREVHNIAIKNQRRKRDSRTIRLEKRSLHIDKESLSNTNTRTLQSHDKKTVYEECGYSNTEHETHNSLNLSCYICNKTFAGRNHFKRHIDAVHLRIRYRCDVCHKSFSRKERLKKHVCETNKSNEVQNVEHLPPTEIITSTNSDLPPKQNNVMKNLTFECNICQRHYVSKTNLIRHQNTNHFSKNRFRCDSCFRSYNRKYDLWSHKKYRHRAGSTTVNANGSNDTNIRSFTCGICSKGFPSIEDCKEHCKMQHDKVIEKPLLLNKPVKIDKSTESVTAVLYCQSASIRDWKEFKQDRRYTCEICGALFSDKAGEKRHNIKFHLNPHRFPLYQLQCNHCQETFPSYKQCYSHYVASHNSEPYDPKLVRSQECDKHLVERKSNHAFQADEASGNNKSLDSVDSSLSEQSTVKRNYQEEAIVNVADERNDECPNDNNFHIIKEKNDSTGSEENGILKTNIDNENNQETPENCGYMMQCSLCDLVCFSYMQIQRHHKQNHQDKPFRFIKLVNDGLRKGLADGATKEQSKKFPPIFVPKKSKTCPYCKKSFMTLKSEHLIKCKMFSLHCKVCGKGFNSEEDLELHEPIHHIIKGKEVKCHICDKKFASNAGRLNHSRLMHYGIRKRRKTFSRKKLTPEEAKARKVVCDVCGKVIRNRYDLIGHMKIHTGEKSYICDICGYKCTRSDNLLTHKRVHTGDKPYKCDQCGKQFTRGDNMKTHIRKMHQ